LEGFQSFRVSGFEGFQGLKGFRVSGLKLGFRLLSLELGFWFLVFGVSEFQGFQPIFTLKKS
jgi:hypothetical protein